MSMVFIHEGDNERQKRLRRIGFQWVEDFAPDRRWRFYAECRFCNGTNQLRDIRDIRAPVLHEADCDFPLLMSCVADGEKAP